MSFIAVAIGAVGAIGGALISGNAAQNAANTQAQAAQNAAAEQQYQFNVSETGLAPYQNSGTGALNLLDQLYGIAPYSGPTVQQAMASPNGNPAYGNTGYGGAGYVSPTSGNPSAFAPQGGGPTATANPILQNATGVGGNPGATASSSAQLNPQVGGGSFSVAPSGGVPTPGSTALPVGASGTPAAGSPNYSAFYNTPGYQFSLNQGETAIQRGAAATGGLYSTGTLASLNNYAQGAASTQYNNYVQQLLSLSGLGGSAAATGAGASTATGAGASNSITNAGNASAGGIMGAAGAFSNGLNSLTNPNGTGGILANAINSGNQPAPYNYAVNPGGGGPGVAPSYNSDGTLYTGG